MRFARTLAVLVALSLLARCGTAFLPTQHDPAPLFVAKAESAPVVAVIPEARPVAVVTPVPETPPEVAERTFDYHVRDLLGTVYGYMCGNGRSVERTEAAERELLALGESSFPVYERILVDPDSRWGEVLGACDLIASLPSGRRFVPFAVALLDSGGDLRRGAAAELLGVIGGERDAPTLLPLLNAGDWSLRRTAAKALAKIGGRNELEALNTWLAGQNQQNLSVVPIRKHRDELGLRLLAQPQRRPF